MMVEMKKNTLVIDDISHHEMEKLIEIYKPDIIGSGIKDKFVIEKMGVPCKQLHSYDYSGPYAAFTGAVNFYQEVDRMLTTKVWKFITPPWEKDPQSSAELVHALQAEWREEKQRSQSLAQTRRGGADEPVITRFNLSTNKIMLNGTTAEIKPREALRINPAKTCQPIGAMYAALGIHGCMPHSHGSQGCCAYHRSHLTRHFKEPVVATSSSFTEGASVFGGLANMTQALVQHLHDLQSEDRRRPHDLFVRGHRRRHSDDDQEGHRGRHHSARAKWSSTRTRRALSVRTSPVLPAWSPAW